MPHDPEDAATAAALKRFEADGSDLSRPMTVDFFVSVPSREAGERVAAHAGAVGFGTRLKADGNAAATWTCYCEQTMVATFEAVREVERVVDAIGRLYGGHGDGFGSYGNAPKPS
jgi:Regulator of ribonuclease activity B